LREGSGKSLPPSHWQRDIRAKGSHILSESLCISGLDTLPSLGEGWAKETGGHLKLLHSGRGNVCRYLINETNPSSSAIKIKYLAQATLESLIA
jgi:hypothetical protein